MPDGYAVVAGLGDGAYAMANNVYVQYDVLKQHNPEATIEELLKQINWRETLVEGGVNFAITSIATGVVLYARSNPKFVNFARQLETKIKAQGTVFLNAAGLDAHSIDLLLRKLGISTKLEDGVVLNSNLPSRIRQLITKPGYLPYRIIWSKANKTVTFIGKWDEVIEGQQRGLQKVLKELSESDLNIYMQSGKFDNPGGFNMLSIENWNDLASSLKNKGIEPGTKAFDDYIWEAYNKPWLESALQRGDEIILWSRPFNLKKTEYIDGTFGPSFYERELNFLKSNANNYGYKEFSEATQTGNFLKMN